MWIDGRVSIVGPLRRAIAAVGVGQDVTVVRIDPLVARKWIGVPLNHLTDQIVPLDDVDRGAASSLSSYLEIVQFPTDIGIAQLLPQSLAEKRVEQARKWLGQRKRVGVVASQLGLSERQLERLFADFTGLAPKTYQRILRFRDAVFAAKRGVGLVYAAADAGYADQAHFSREARDLTGRSLKTLLANVGNLQDIAAGNL